MKKVSNMLKGLLVIMALSTYASAEYHTWCWSDASCINWDEEVTLLDSNAYFDEDENVWKLNIKGWIYEEELYAREAKYLSFITLLELAVGAPDEEVPFLRERVYPFLVDNKGNERIIVLINGKKYYMNPSNGNGLFDGEITLSDSEVQAMKDSDGYINYKLAVPYFENRAFKGKVKVVEPIGTMVISDIDDTIKISEVYIGKTELIRNTFYKEVEIANGMLALFQQFKTDNANTTFHYVSGSPLQLYGFIHDLLEENGFEEGSIHLKGLRLNPLSAELYDFIDPDSTYVHKIAAIGNMMEKNPDKEFILVGDTGEKDPEVYGKLLELYPSQIKSIYLRNVTGETADNARMMDIFADYAENVTLISM